MRKHIHQASALKKNRDFVMRGLALGHIDASFELPDADEFICSDEEVREACAGLEGTHEGLMD